jgi:hypothetical protein
MSTSDGFNLFYGGLRKTPIRCDEMPCRFMGTERQCRLRG